MELTPPKEITLLHEKSTKCESDRMSLLCPISADYLLSDVA